jgi:hypothetical protein
VISHRQTRRERAAEGSFPYCVALRADRCTGANYDLHRQFCTDNELRLSRYSLSVIWEDEWYSILRFAEAAHAALFMKAFDGEPFDPAERGRGVHWMQWNKGTSKPKVRDPYDFG